MYAGNPQFLYHEDDGSPEGYTTIIEIVDDFVESFDYEGKGYVGDYERIGIEMEITGNAI